MTAPGTGAIDPEHDDGPADRPACAMDTLTSLRVFRQVVESGSFTAAAARLDISLAMASKHVAHLERELHSRLLNRSSRHVSLTDAGTRYYAHCRDALDVLDGAAADLSRDHQAPHGLLRITAPVWSATPAFATLLAEYRSRHPQVTLDVSLSNDKVDLAAGRFDLALRVTPEPAPSLIVRPVCRIPFWSVASPGCLARFASAQGLRLPRPQTIEEAAGLPAILPSYLPQLTTLPLTDDAPGLRVDIVMRSDNTMLACEAARAGLAATLLPEWLIRDDLAAGRLVPVLPGLAPRPIPLYAAYTSRRYLTPKVRRFIDLLLERLGDDPQEIPR